MQLENLEGGKMRDWMVFNWIVFIIIGALIPGIIATGAYLWIFRRNLGKEWNRWDEGTCIAIMFGSYAAGVWLALFCDLMKLSSTNSTPLTYGAGLGGLLTTALALPIINGITKRYSERKKNKVDRRNQIKLNAH